MSKWRTIEVEEWSDLRKCPHTPGVYAIYSDGKLYYVGMAADVATRLQGHRQTGVLGAMRDEGCRMTVKVRADRFYGERGTLELRLIRRLQPFGNSTSKTEPVSLRRARERDLMIEYHVAVCNAQREGAA